MISKPTILILGAGASKPYGFPTGPELKQIILENLTSNNPQWFEALDAQNVDKSFASRFAAQFMRSGRITIDSFLSFHSEFIPVGKICIALALIPFEEQNRLHPLVSSDDEGWYDYFSNKLATPNGITQSGNITIITFNYDRSLDQYIYDVLADLYSTKIENSEIDINRLLDSIPIHHIHGQLGRLPWNNRAARRYYPDLDRKSLEIAWKSIRVPSEQHENKPMETIIDYSLRQSARIYFLGFSYDEDNLEKLGIKNMKDKTIIGTSFGLTDLERNDITSKWGIELPKDNCKILEFLRNHAPLD